MHRMIWLCCVVGLLTVVVAAQAPQNPALAGGEPVAQIPDTNPFSSEADIQAGEALFQKHCSYCHGSFGEGGRGADLTTACIAAAGAIRSCTPRFATAFPEPRWRPCA